MRVDIFLEVVEGDDRVENLLEVLHSTYILIVLTVVELAQKFHLRIRSSAIAVVGRKR